MTKRSSVEVIELLGSALADLHFHVLSGENSLKRLILHPRVQKPGLAFAGFYQYIKPGRVQIIGESELEFLSTLDPEVRDERLRGVASQNVPVFVITKGLRPPDIFLAACKERGVPVLSTGSFSSTTIKRISFFLEDQLVPAQRIHGVLLEILSLGVLLIGKSGIGKSETALELIGRGHSLVADDLITVKLYPSGELWGYCEEAGRYHMELRGIGIVNIRDIFGLSSIREKKKIDLVVELVPWSDAENYERIGVDQIEHELLGEKLPLVRMPVASGRNMASLVEVAARHHILKLQGANAPVEFLRRLGYDMG